MKVIEITDTVEVGHFPLIGGTADISVSYVRDYISDDVDIEALNNTILEKIDMLDHCTVTDNEEAIKFSDRYFLLDKSESLLDDIQSVLSLVLNDIPEFNNTNSSISVKINKVKLIDTIYTNTCFTSNVVKYEVKG